MAFDAAYDGWPIIDSIFEVLLAQLNCEAGRRTGKENSRPARYGEGRRGLYPATPPENAPLDVIGRSKLGCLGPRETPGKGNHWAREGGLPFSCSLLP
jgi:hypothetical protein